MPIYEFYCRDCHTVFNFFSRRVDTDTRPRCPGCGRPELERRASLFALSKGRAQEEDGLDGVDEARMERALESMAGDIDGLDEDNPRDAARMIRRFVEASGMQLGGAMEEAVRRMEAGDDPEQVEAELGDVLDDEDLFSARSGRVIQDLRRRYLPPKVDKTLHDLHPEVQG